MSTKSYQGKQFKNSPLIETVFEIRFPIELSVDCNRDKFYKEVKDEFTQIIPPEPMPMQPNILQPLRIIDPVKKNIINFSAERFSFVTKQYNGFDDFLFNCNKYIEIFVKTFNINKILRTGLRNINFINFGKKENGVIPINKVLNFGFNLPQIIPNDKIETFNTGFVTKINDGLIRVLISTQAIRSDEENTLVLDFDYYIEKEIPSGKIEEALINSHSHTEKIFLDIVTKDYLDSIS